VPSNAIDTGSGTAALAFPLTLALKLEIVSPVSLQQTVSKGGPQLSEFCACVLETETAGVT
jgi:hypothetical protein